MQRYMYRVAEASNRIVDYIRIANESYSAKRFWIMILKPATTNMCAELVVFCIAGVPAMRMPIQSVLDGKNAIQIAALNIISHPSWGLQINTCCENTVASVTKKEEP